MTGTGRFSRRKADAAISVNGDDASIASGGLVARIHHRGQISFFDSKGELLLEERWRTRSSGSSFSSLEVKGRELRPVGGTCSGLLSGLSPVTMSASSGWGNTRTAAWT